jgi:uncharacterized protein (TIGR03435 family)
LRSLIKFAWDFQDNDVRDNDDMLVGGPKWLETERFDIVARPAAPATPSGPHAAVDVVAVGSMLRALLVDRFKLATHSDEQPVWVYAMVADSPKLKRADSTNRPGCRNAPAPPGKTNAPGPVFSLVCQNLTMAQLAERLQPMGGIYVPHPVVDLTGLAGAWDFVISWSPPHLLGGCGGCDRETGLAAAAAYAATDPYGSLTLVEALNRQLGLKLKLQKHFMPVGS